MHKQNAATPKKKNLWALLKESMDKASSGCGPGCGCHVETPRQENQGGGTPTSSGSEAEKL